MSNDAKDPLSEVRALLAAGEDARRARDAAEATLNAMGGEDPGVTEASLAARMADFAVDDAERVLGGSTRLIAALCDELVLSRKVIGALDFFDSVAAETPILQPGELENASRVYEEARGALEAWRDLQRDVPASTDEQFARIATTTKLIETATWYRDARAKLDDLASARNGLIATWETTTPSSMRAAIDACRMAERHADEMHEWLLAAALAMPERKVPDERS